jgi:hypothetical protein
MTTNNDTLTLSVADLDQVLPSEYTVLPPGDPRNDNPHALRALLNEESSQTYFFSSALEYLKFAVTVASRNRLLAENCGTRYIQLSASYDSDAYFHASVTHTVAAFTQNMVALHRMKSDETSVRFELSLEEMAALTSGYQSYQEDCDQAGAEEEATRDPFLDFPDDHL